MFDINDPLHKYRDMDEHEMVEDDLCRCIAGCHLGLLMKLYKRVTTLHATEPNHACDDNITASFLARIENHSHLPDMKVMGALLHPLYQNSLQLIAVRYLLGEDW